MRRFSRGFIVSALAAGAIVGTMLRWASADNATPSPAPAASPYVVTIKNFAFSPSNLTVPVGATVTWKNQDSAAHTATSTVTGFDSGNLDGGQSYSFTFKKSGSYPYLCSYHSNMTGTIVVEAAK